MHVNEDGAVVVATGSPDSGGSRAGDHGGRDAGGPIGVHTASVGYAHLTGGSRVTAAPS
jgi:hypothetical protein